MNNVGGDLFAVVCDARTQKVCEQTGRESSIGQRCGVRATGALCAGTGPSRWTPGVVEGWNQLLRASAASLGKALQPAIGYARGSFGVQELAAADWENATARLRAIPRPQRRSANGRARQARSPGQPGARAGLIANGGRDAFYRGAIAQAIAAEQGARVPSIRDLAAHRADWVEPISTIWRLRRHRCRRTLRFGGARMLNLWRVSVRRWSQRRPHPPGGGVEEAGVADRSAYLAIATSCRRARSDAPLEGVRGGHDLVDMRRASASQLSGRRRGRGAREVGQISKTRLRRHGLDRRRSRQRLSLIRSLRFVRGHRGGRHGNRVKSGSGFSHPGHPNQIGPSKHPAHVGAGHDTEGRQAVSLQ